MCAHIHTHKRFAHAGVNTTSTKTLLTQYSPTVSLFTILTTPTTYFSSLWASSRRKLLPDCSTMSSFDLAISFRWLVPACHSSLENSTGVYSVHLLHMCCLGFLTKLISHLISVCLVLVPLFSDYIYVTFLRHSQ